MNTAKYADEQIQKMKADGTPRMEAAWKTAQLCVGWPYIFGDRGEYCTPTNRRAAYNRTAEGKSKQAIKTKCKNFDGTGTCAGCKYYPGGKTRAFDCRGFTYWVLLQIYGWKLMGAGCTTQWNNANNWKAKGSIDSIPENTLVCLFYRDKKDPSVMSHTGLGYRGQTCECSNGVQYFKTRDKKWEYWAIPACVEGDEPPVPTPPDPGDDKPTLRKGDSGTYVSLLQEMLMQRGYALPKYGADGKFGCETQNAVRAFQRDHGLTDDGIVGSATWDALEGQEPTRRYTVTVPHLTIRQAEAIIGQYPGATKTEEG